MARRKSQIRKTVLRLKYEGRNVSFVVGPLLSFREARGVWLISTAISAVLGRDSPLIAGNEAGLCGARFAQQG